MTNKEAIKYLQQLYPNDGHCWLDEQRIEAIGMAVKALQEEPVSEESMKETANKYAIESYPDEPSTGQFGTGDYESYVNMSGQRECAVEDFKAGAKWKEQQIMSKAIDASCFDRFQGSALFSFRLPTDKYLVGSDVKVIIINED